jgi:excisionase family DNA binding protein
VGETKLVSVEELAAIVGISARTVYRLVEDEKIPAYRVRRQLRFDQAEVLEALREAEEAPA